MNEEQAKARFYRQVAALALTVRVLIWTAVAFGSLLLAAQVNMAINH